jgi:hypothetical protein
MRTGFRLRRALQPVALLASGLGILHADLAALAQSQSQVFIVESEHQKNIPPFQATHVTLDDRKLTPRGHRELITAFTAEQGFARRPLPLDSRGLLLRANGDLKPDGLDYEELLQRKGVSSKAGDRLVISDIRIEGNKIVFDFNGGPDHKHKFLRHVSIGGGGGEVPVVRDNGQEPVGSRLTLLFSNYVPEMTPDQLRALIQPLMDFNVKTPLEAYVDTLPPKLKEAILNHHVLVGMDRKMVIYAIGQPRDKVRESTNGVAFEEWIYGEAPQPTQFIRFEGNRVVQVETGAIAADLVVRKQDETDGYTSENDIHEVKMGDAAPSTNGDSVRHNAPSLRLPGEELPGTSQPVNKPGQPVDHPQPIPSSAGGNTQPGAGPTSPHWRTPS